MFIADSHNDFLIEAKPTKLEIENYITSLIKNNVKYINFAFFTSQLKNFNLDYAVSLKNYINNLKLNSKIKIVYSIEDMNFFNFKDIDKLKELAPISCGLTWNLENQYGGGAFSRGNLTANGKKLVKILEENNILIDMAHLNKKSFYQVLDISNKKIINTHCGFNLIKNHKRNLNDDQIKLIIERNGYIGLTFVKDFYDKRFSFNINYLANCISQIIYKYGIENFGIGTDFFGTTSLPIDLKNYQHFEKLYQQMLLNGFHKNEIDKIFHKNFEKLVKIT